METSIAMATIDIDIECGQESLERAQSNTVVSDVSKQGYHSSRFEKKCHFTLNQLYKDWKSNEWGKSPICIPAAMEVHEKWFIRTLDPNAVDYNERIVNNRMGKLRGDNAERIVHQAFQRSNIGGILIQGVDYGALWDVLKESSDISSDLKEQLNPSQSGGMDMFEIDFLFFHPSCGIFIMECKAYDESKNLLVKECKSAMGQAKQARENLLNFFKILTGTQFPSEIVHVVLCLPKLKKENIEGINQEDILDEEDFNDNLLFEEFWKAQIAKHQGVGVNYFENMRVSRLSALSFGFRSAEVTSLASNSLEILRKIDSQESSESKRKQFNFGNKTLFLNSEQLKAYNRAKRGQNMVLFGPPGSGKTLLIQLLAKEASEKEGKGRVIIILPYEELTLIYENFFKGNRENQKREIIINPSLTELQRSLTSDSFDDIFADEILYGGWIPKEHRPNGQIVAGITTGRQYEKSGVAFARDKLEKRLINDNFFFFELKSAMRNTGKICEYFNQFEQKPDNQIVIGHNIEGSNVIEITTSDTKSASIEIANRIKQLLGKEDEGSRNSINYYCSPADIAVLVAHEPVSCQINQIKKALKKAGIETGSITEQVAAGTKNQNLLVAVDCSANVLLLEWPIVFVVNATECPYSKNIASPIVTYSTAVSSLIVINTQDCKFPYLKYFCKAVFAQIFFNFFETYDMYQYNDIWNESVRYRSRGLKEQFLFWLGCVLYFIGIPFMLLINPILFYLSIDKFGLINVVHLAAITILVLLYIASGVVLLKNLRKIGGILGDLIMICSFGFIIVYSIYNSNRGIITFFILGTLFMINYIRACYEKAFYLRHDYTIKYFEKPKYKKYSIGNLYIAVFSALIVASTPIISDANNFFLFFQLIVILWAPSISVAMKLPMHPKKLKSISIQPL